jgi:O-antigen/teichoic acid export membrane protein
MSGVDIPGSALLLRFRVGLTWNVFGAVATQGGAFLASVAVARIVGQQNFGAFAILSSTVLTAAGIAQLSTAFTVTKFVAEFRHSDPARAARVLALCRLVALTTGILAILALAVASDTLAARVLAAPTLGSLLVLASGYVLFAVTAGVEQGALAGCEAFRVIAWRNILAGVGHVTLCTSGALLFGVRGAVAALSLSALLRLVAMSVALRQVWPDRVQIPIIEALRERGVILTFAIPAAMSGIISMSAIWVGNAILVNGQSGLAQMALFGAAFSLRTLIVFLPNMVDNVGATLLNSERGAANPNGYWRVFRINLLASGTLAAAASLVTAGLAQPLMRLFGPEFGAGALSLQILALAACVQALANTLYQLVQSEGRMWFSLLAVCLPRDAVTILLALLLVPHFSANGLAAAHAVGACVGLAVLAAAMYRRGGLRAGAVGKQHV